jgi:hypothetical protein
MKTKQKHSARKDRMLLMSVMNDSPEAHQIGKAAMGTGKANIRRAQLEAMKKDGPKHPAPKRRGKRKSKTQEMSMQ